jgi:hypothetical protein
MWHTTRIGQNSGQWLRDKGNSKILSAAGHENTKSEGEGAYQPDAHSAVFSPRLMFLAAAVLT